jgi:hypothetical protein
MLSKNKIVKKSFLNKVSPLSYNSLKLSIKFYRFIQGKKLKG